MPPRLCSIDRILAGGLCLLALLGCEKSARNMYEQPKYRPMEPSALWPDGRSARPLEAGVVARSAGVLAASSSGRRADVSPADQAAAGPEGTARAAGAVAAASAAPTGSLEALQRGRERYNIYCAPCHSVNGDGDGMVVRRGFPAPGSLHSAALRAASDAQLFEFVSRGYGVMYGFADRIGPQDRWAIVAYLRALQRSQHATVNDVPPAEQRELLGEAR